MAILPVRRRTPATLRPAHDSAPTPGRGPSAWQKPVAIARPGTGESAGSVHRFGGPTGDARHDSTQLLVYGSYIIFWESHRKKNTGGGKGGGGKTGFFFFFFFIKAAR